MSGAESGDEPEGASGGDTDGKVQSRRQGEKPESAEDTAPAVAAPKTTAAPKIDSGASESSGSSLFDSSWKGLLGEDEPKAPGAPLFAPPGAHKAPETTPRTSDGSPAVSGEFGVPDKLAEVEAAKDEPNEGDGEQKHDEPTKADDEPDRPESEPDPSDDEPDPSEEQPVKADDEPDRPESEPDPSDDEPEPEEKLGDDDEQPPEAAGSPGAKAKPNEGGLGLGTILAIAFAILLIVLFVYNSAERSRQEGSPGPSKPNQAAKELPEAEGPRPQPRPPKVKTHAADPALEALRAREQGTSEADEDEAGEAETETAGTETGEPVEPPEPAPTPTKVDDPRDPSLIPPGTPEENAKAFIKLPVSLHDGPPLGGIGRSGIHVDAISMSRGRDNSECDDPTRSFATTETEFVNVCFRVVHPRAKETLRVIWEKDGAVTRRGKVRIPENLHAYKTRAYLQVRPEYVGSWRVRIVPEGEEDTDLAVADFEIKE